jgi:hypothetical protein
MRRLLVLTIILFAIIFSACQQEYVPDGFTTTPPGAGAFRAKIDGVQWEALSVKTATRQANVIVLYGSTAGNKSILLRVADSGVHNYTFHNQSMGNVAALTDSTENPNAYTTNQWDIVGTYGNLNITAIDTARKTMSGTFSLRVYRQLDTRQHIITEGVFTNLSYSTQPPAPASTDSFRVKIDGVNFTYNLLAGVAAFGKINISAAQTVAPAVGLSLPANVVPGTYPFDILDFVGQYNPSTTVFLGADTGRVTILEHNTVTKRIRGNFNFLANTVFTNLPPNVQLTEGYFSVRYQ